MKWIKKDNNREPWETRTDSLTDTEPKSGWKRALGGAILCAMLLLAGWTAWTMMATDEPTGDLPDTSTSEEAENNAQYTTYSAKTAQDTLQAHLELYGEDPTLMTLQLFCISEVYDTEGQKVEVKNLLTLPEGHLYVDENQQGQYVYYDGGVYVVTPDGKIQGRFNKPSHPGEIQIRAFTNFGHGHTVESQHYGFERTSERQSCALLHFVNAKSDETVAEDLMVFFEASDHIEILFPKIDNLETLSSGCRSGVAFELTVKYYEPENVYKQAPGTTSIDPACVCVDVQPDGYPVVDPTAVTVTNEDGISEVLKGQDFDGVYKDGKDPE